MSNKTWPNSTQLPQFVDEEGFQESIQDPVIRTSMDTGPQKQRLRYTATPEIYDITMLLTKTQRATFLTFFKEDLRFGVEEFSWVHPVTHTACYCRFRGPYTFTPVGIDFRLAISMEVLP